MKILIDTNVIIDFLLGADYIVTRNVQDFACSVIPAITPAQFCQQFFAGG